jgi:hypothetical protein
MTNSQLCCNASWPCWHAVHCLSTDSRRLAITPTTVNCHTTNATFRLGQWPQRRSSCVVLMQLPCVGSNSASNTTSSTTVSVVYSLGKAVTLPIEFSVHTSSTAQLKSSGMWRCLRVQRFRVAGFELRPKLSPLIFLSHCGQELGCQLKQATTATFRIPSNSLSIMRSVFFNGFV